MFTRSTLRLAAAVAALAAGTVAQVETASAQWWDEPGYSERRTYRPSLFRGYQDRYRARNSDPFGEANRRYGRQRWYSEDWQDDEDNDEDAFDRRALRRAPPADAADDDDREERATDEAAASEEVASGGARPEVSAQAPPSVPFPSSFKPGSIVIDQSKKKLYYVLSDDEALRYDISVGREGFSWTGTEKVSRIADWPDWHPPAEMRERDPRLPKKMTGGLKNPLGAKAIYLGNTLYRIHGTNDPKSIGRAASSGCFRMMNEHVVHLASLVQVGAEVHVLAKLPMKVAGSR